MGTNGSTMLEPLRQGLPPLDPATVSNAASRALPPCHEAVRLARRFTGATLDGWRLDERRDDVRLVVSELVTNALRHALSADPRHGCEPPAAVRLHLLRWPGLLVCAVRDPSQEGPVARQTEDFSAESGRGLFLVESFSDGWGWHPMTAPGGKVVWASFRVSRGCPAG
ncbi:ATP-binding protein [Streptomyces sp. ZYX-F-203]